MICDHSLSNGLTGIATFASACASVLDDELAQRRADYLVGQMADELRWVFDLMKDYEGAWNDVISTGEGSGLAGILTGIALIGRCYADERLKVISEEFLTFLDGAGFAGCTETDRIGGLAGLVSTLSRFEEYREHRPAIRAAADRLLELKDFSYRDMVLWKTLPTVTRALSGAGHGMAGIAEALLAAASVLDDERYVSAALEALAYERSVYGRSAWRLTARQAEVMLACDGMHDLDTDATVMFLALRKLIEPCEKGEAPSEWSALREYGNRHFPMMNLMITGRCNFNCLHCFNAADNNALATEWSFEDVCELLDQAHDCGVASFMLTGGEPMMHRRFLDIVREIYRRDMTVFALNTNGHFISEETLAEMAALGCRPQIKVSFDGIGTHDWMRNRAGAEESTVDAMRLCAESGFHVVSNTQVNRRNVHTNEPSAPFSQPNETGLQGECHYLELSARIAIRLGGSRANDRGHGLPTSFRRPFFDQDGRAGRLHGRSLLRMRFKPLLEKPHDPYELLKIRTTEAVLEAGRNSSQRARSYRPES